jgi:hypothetical protein
MDPRLEFRQLVAERERLRDETHARRSRAESKHWESLEVEARRQFPKSRVTLQKLVHRLNTETVTRLNDQAREAWLAEQQPRDARINAIDTELQQLAPVVPILPGPARLWRAVSESSYSSQGWGAPKYARQAAQLDVDHAQGHGVPAEIRKRMIGWCATCNQDVGIYDSDWNAAVPDHKDQAGRGCPGVAFKTHHGSLGQSSWRFVCHYEVWVSVAEDLDIEVLRLKPDIPLRETVRLCWKRGVNPRVYMPFLPHGYEEQEGLDRFGGERNRAGTETV